MNALRIALFWKGDIPSSKLVGPLMSEVRGIPAVRPVDRPLIVGRGLVFEDQFWSRARVYLDMIRAWLRRQGISEFYVEINQQSLEHYLEDVTAERDMARDAATEAVKELKSSRFSIPNPRIKRVRQLLESVL